MDKEYVNLKVDADTRKKLKLLAVMMGKTMMEVIDQLASEALDKQQNADSKSV